ncbi:MAG TPA: GNAT family N-acetyltransferase [Actinomycetota bacterium]|nr:GNAT family N-acetyltransferase [Actinomycetota bacterium]
MPSLRTPDAPVRGERTQVRLATSDDADMLVAWHADPEVARFWDGSTYTREEMVERLTRSEVDPYIVEANGEPIGYLQAWCNDDIPGVAGLDMFLVPSARDRGLGPDAGRALATWLLGPGGVHHVTVDPYVENERAVRGWEKAGFRRLAKAEPDDEHTKPWFLMVFGKP